MGYGQEPDESASGKPDRTFAVGIIFTQPISMAKRFSQIVQ